MNRKNKSIDFFNNDDNVNPMDGVSNMSDAMLVLAVGIMLALVINWKIDIKEAMNSVDVEKVSIEENKLNEIELDDENQSSNFSFDDIEKKYIKSGTLYTDTFTGKTYVVVDE